MLGRCAYIGCVMVGSLGISGCSDSHPSQGSPGNSGGCQGTQCVPGSGGTGAGGAAGSAGMPGTSGSAGTGAGGATVPPSSCMVLKLAQGTTAPDGVLALHAPPADAFGDVYGGGIAVADGYVYFDFKAQLTRVPVAGGAPQPIHSTSRVGEPFFVIDGNVVWIDQDPMTMAYSILKVPASSSGSGTPSVVASAIDTPDVLAWDSTAIYFSNRDKSIFYKAPLDGSGATQLIANVLPLGAVAAGGNLYWIDDKASQVMSIPTTGGQTTALVSVFFGGPMVAEGSTLYWNDTSDEAINRWSPGDKSPTKLASFEFLNGAGSIAVSRGDLYYTPEGFGCGGIGRIPGDGSRGSTFAKDFDSPSGVALDADSVYVVAWNGVFKVHR